MNGLGYAVSTDILELDLLLPHPRTLSSLPCRCGDAAL